MLCEFDFVCLSTISNGHFAPFYYNTMIIPVVTAFHDLKTFYFNKVRPSNSVTSIRTYRAMEQENYILRSVQLFFFLSLNYNLMKQWEEKSFVAGS